MLNYCSVFRSAMAKKKPPYGDSSRWVRYGSAGAEHVTAIAHVIVRHERCLGLPMATAATLLVVGEFIGGDHVAQRERSKG